MESAVNKNGRGGNAENNTYPLIYACHVHDDKHDKQAQQPACEYEKVLRFETQAKYLTPCRISAVGFQELASEPDLQVSLYPALH
jgi:hypothetical protein